MTSTTAAPTATHPPLPDPSPLTQFFWDGVNEGRLMILQCQQCHRYIHWPREVCRFCLSTNLAPAEMSGRGRVATYTIPLQPFDAFNRARVPYVLAVVELVEQEHLHVVTNIVDCDQDDVRVGMDVEVVYREVAPGLTLPLFRPIESDR
jgi:hypothetical protein